MVASHQALEAMKILIGSSEALNRKLLNFDAWSGRVAMLNVQKSEDCPCCKHASFEFLEGKFASSATSLCGRDAVQISPPAGLEIDFSLIAAKLRNIAHAEPKFNAFMLKAEIAPHELTVFADGRAIIKGTNKPEEARSIYAKYIGA
jgi:molybdopterin-synthase adenylyltransferase